MGLSGCHYIIIGRVVLEHQPHRLNIILSTAPISLSAQIAQRQLGLQISCDSRSRARDLPRYKVLTVPRRFVVVKNAVANKEAVGFSIHSRQLRRKSFGASIRAGRPQRRALGLGKLTCIPEKFRKSKRDKIATVVPENARFRVTEASPFPLLRKSILESRNSGRHGFVRRDDIIPSAEHPQ